MTVVDSWTGRHANALRVATRATNESFAEVLGLGVRTVARWNAEPDLVPVPEMQRVLDTALDKAPAAAQARFWNLVSADTNDSRAPQSIETAAAQAWAANDDERLAGVLDLLDRQAGWEAGDARHRVERFLSATSERAMRDLSRRRASIDRALIAESLITYYSLDGVRGASEARPYRFTIDGVLNSTSILTMPNWLDIAADLRSPNRSLTLHSVPGPDFVHALDDVGSAAAVERVAESVALATQLVDAPIYRMSGLTSSADGLDVELGLSTFAGYALTADLLERELADALSESPEVSGTLLPLRSRYLPTVEAVVDVKRRICAGGVLSLFAAARPGRRGHADEPDYVILVQERSGRVLNADRRLAVIPKAFHQPMSDYREDVALGATLERELEEELFGREEVDSTKGRSRRGDPMHPSLMTTPMRWLHSADRDAWRMECTGFGFNLVSGNYEFASLVAVDDEAWWTEYGGTIEANWESDGLRTYSTRDHAGIRDLIADPQWTNEGLFALIQGLRRLREISPARLDLPIMEIESRVNDGQLV